MPQDDTDNLFEADEQDDAPSAEELRAQAEEARRERDAARADAERERGRLDSFLRGTRSETPTRAQAQPPLGPQPDPAVDFEGFQRWDAERERRRQAELDARLERIQEETRQSATEESRTTILWTRFQAKYPQYASRAALVRTAYVELSQRGALPADVEGAVDAVRREMDAIVGVPLDSVKAPADRTAGTSGNVPPAQPGRKSKGQANDTPSTFHESISRKRQEFGLL